MTPEMEAEVQPGDMDDAPGGVWMRESVPEEFLREVVDTLTGFLRESSSAPEAKSGYVAPES